MDCIADLRARPQLKSRAAWFREKWGVPLVACPLTDHVGFCERCGWEATPCRVYVHREA